MDIGPYSDIQRGTFLIATPDIEGGFFFRGVILICEHNANGSFGLLVNKKLELELPSEILNISQLNPSRSARSGMPCSPRRRPLRFWTR